MGYNTTVVVLNDALGEIARDKQFGKKLVDAILRATLSDTDADISSGHHVNAATVIETHHADTTAVIAVGGNCGINLGVISGSDDKLEILREIADLMGYTLRKKARR